MFVHERSPTDRNFGQNYYVMNQVKIMGLLNSKGQISVAFWPTPVTFGVVTCHGSSIETIVKLIVNFNSAKTSLRYAID